MTEEDEQPPIPPQEEVDERTTEERRIDSVNTNLKDEKAVRLINARYTILKEDGGPDHNHAAAVMDALLDIVTGINNHMSEEISIARIVAKESFTSAVNNGKSERESLIIGSNAIVAGLESIFSNTIWMNEQTEHFQTIIDEQVPDGVLSKGFKGFKKLVLFAPNKAIDLAGWGLNTVTFGVFKRKGKKVS